MMKMTTISALALAATVSVASAGGFGAAGTEGQCAQEQRDKDGKCPALILPTDGVGGLNNAGLIAGLVTLVVIAGASSSSGSH